MTIRTLTWFQMNLGILILAGGLFGVFGPWALVALGSAVAISMLLFGDFGSEEGNE